MFGVSETLMNGSKPGATMDACIVRLKNQTVTQKKKKIVLYYKSYEVYYGKNLSQVLKHM